MSPIYFHSHDFYEIYLFMDGNVHYYIEDENYALSRGNVLVIPPGKLHRPVFDGDLPYERYVLWIYQTQTADNTGIRRFLEAIDRMTAEKNTRLAAFENQTLQTLTVLFDRLFNSFQSEDALTQYTSKSCLVLILDEILHCLTNMEPAADHPDDLIPQVISYINQNVVCAPSLDDLSASFFVSKYHLSHRFKEHTKTTIHQYILMKKVNLAKELLSTGLSPQEVCEKCGFSTYSNFYKIFTEQTGISPKKFGKETIASLPRCCNKK